MNRSVIVYGPKGCGKTTHGEHLRLHYGLVKIVDEGMCSNWGKDMQANGVLYLCVKPPRKPKRNGAIIVPFVDAMYFSGSPR